MVGVVAKTGVLGSRGIALATTIPQGFRGLLHQCHGVKPVTLSARLSTLTVIAYLLVVHHRSVQGEGVS